MNRKFQAVLTFTVRTEEDLKGVLEIKKSIESGELQREFEKRESNSTVIATFKEIK